MTQAQRTARSLRSAVLETGHVDRSDRDLWIAYVQQRDAAAFSELVRRFGPMVLATCRRQLGDWHDAEDAFQATFLVLARQADSVRRGEALAGWLHGVAFRIAMKAKRDAARRRAREAKATSPESTDLVADLSWREVLALLDEAVAQLPPLYRETFLLATLDELSNAETARRLGVKEGTICSRLAKAKRLLRVALERRGVSLVAVLAVASLSAGARTIGPSVLKGVLPCVDGSGVGLSAQVRTLAEGALPTMFSLKKSMAVLLFGTILFGAGSAIPSQPLPSAPSVAANAPPESLTDQLTVTGQVLDPEGLPVAGAKMYVTENRYDDRSTPEVRGTTDAAGRFEISITEAEVMARETLVAVAGEYGPDWVDLDELDPGQPVVFKLVSDGLIIGRVRDLEGQPIEGAAIRVTDIWKMPNEDLGPLIGALQKAEDRHATGDVWYRYQQERKLLSGVVGRVTKTTTDREGFFQLSGFGRERVVSLQIEGEDIASTRIDVLTRVGVTGLPPRAHGATFEHVAGPAKPIRGVIRDAKTGKPVVGLRVNAQPELEDGPGAGAFAETDAEGRFEITGLPKAKSYHLNAGGAPYIGYHRTLEDTPGLEPITVDFEVERALALRVHVTDKSTGRPISAYVQYAIRADNRSLDEYPTYPRNVFGWYGTDKSGWSEQTVLPGPAVIAVQAMEGEFTRARPEGESGDSRFVGGVIPAPLMVDSYHAIVPINPKETDLESLTLEIALDPGRSVRGKVVDRDGKPMEGVLAAGLTAAIKAGSHDTETVVNHEFTVQGLEPAYPRTVVFFHPERKLAKAILVTGKEESLTVTLDPVGSLRGQLLDANGDPIAEHVVWATYADSVADTLPGDLAIAGGSVAREKIYIPPATTDAEGRFQFDNLLPGMKYDVSTRGTDGSAAFSLRDWASHPGEEVDVGVVRLDPLEDK